VAAAAVIQLALSCDVPVGLPHAVNSWTPTSPMNSGLPSCFESCSAGANICSKVRSPSCFSQGHFR
jgi:hypothetical protein